MREMLYPWLPEDALVSPHIFYRLMETIRNTLIVKDKKDKGEMEKSEESEMVWNSSVIVCAKLCYNVREHQKIVASIDMMKIKHIFEEPITMEKAVERLRDCLIGYTNADARNFILKMYDHGFIVAKE